MNYFLGGERPFTKLCLPFHVRGGGEGHTFCCFSCDVYNYIPRLSSKAFMNPTAIVKSNFKTARISLETSEFFFHEWFTFFHFWNPHSKKPLV